MREWATFLRDDNPIHLDPAAVAALGLGDRVINQGPANLAYVINMLHAAFPSGTITGLSTRFLGNVRAGDCVVAGGTITSLKADEAECDFELRVVDGEPALAGTATIALNQQLS
ncbi:MAG: hypothetical protein CL807_04650 [Citromicrobium sp.]|nr:hypothetical protein [Citromicrobium sp.]